MKLDKPIWSKLCNFCISIQILYTKYCFHKGTIYFVRLQLSIAQWYSCFIFKKYCHIYTTFVISEFQFFQKYIQKWWDFWLATKYFLIACLRIGKEVFNWFHYSKVTFYCITHSLNYAHMLRIQWNFILYSISNYLHTE